MPPAVATDRQTRVQAIWSDGWMYKGLTTAVRLLRQAKHPRAEEFAREAQDYKAAFLAALRDKCGKMPTWTDPAGETHPLLPTSLFNEDKAETRGAFYLDTGPLFLVFAGLVSADDPMMRSTLEWFRHGPETRMYRPDSNCWQVPCLWREISSCEPGYS
jgi:GH15 family glucan-1,4-alpha-glucosidase